MKLVDVYIILHLLIFCFSFFLQPSYRYSIHFRRIISREEKFQNFQTISLCLSPLFSLSAAVSEHRFLEVGIDFKW